VTPGEFGPANDEIHAFEYPQILVGSLEWPELPLRSDQSLVPGLDIVEKFPAVLDGDEILRLPATVDPVERPSLAFENLGEKQSHIR